MEITKVLKPFIRRGANTFGNIVYMYQICSTYIQEWNIFDLVYR